MKQETKDKISVSMSQYRQQVDGSDEQRFWNYVLDPDLKSGCMLWAGRVSALGRGVFRSNKQEDTAHRAAYKFCFGEIPEGLVICHKCDIEICVNPDHLYAATQTQNIADLSERMNKVYHEYRLGKLSVI